MEALKVQTTLRGYAKWAFEEFYKSQRITVSDAAGRIIDEWLRHNRDYLRDEFDISIKKFNVDLGKEGADATNEDKGGEKS